MTSNNDQLKDTVAFTMPTLPNPTPLPKPDLRMSNEKFQSILDYLPTMIERAKLRQGKRAFLGKRERFSDAQYEFLMNNLKGTGYRLNQYDGCKYIDVYIEWGTEDDDKDDNVYPDAPVFCSSSHL